MSVNTLGASYADGKSRGGAWLLPLAPIAISIFAISALVSYHLRASSITPRTIPQSVVIGVYEFLGWVPACMFFGLVFAWSSIWFVAGSIERPGRKLLRVFGLTVALAVFGNLDASAPHTGALGAWIGGGMASVFGSFLSHLLMAPITFLALLFATDSFWMSYFERRVLERTRAELQAAAAGAASDAGVEPAVPEEFKQLARTLPPEAAEAAADAEAETDVEAYFERLDRGAVVGAEPAVAQDADDSPQVADLPVAEEAAPSRLSYFERRRLREEQEAQRAGEAAAAEDPAIEARLFEGLGEQIAEPEAAASTQDEPLSEAPVAELARVEEPAAVDVVQESVAIPSETADPIAEPDAPDDAMESGDPRGSYEVRTEPLFASPSARFVVDEGDAEPESKPETESEHAARSAADEDRVETATARAPLADAAGDGEPFEDQSVEHPEAGRRNAWDEVATEPAAEADVVAEPATAAAAAFEPEDRSEPAAPQAIAPIEQHEAVDVAAGEPKEPVVAAEQPEFRIAEAAASESVAATDPWVEGGEDEDSPHGVEAADLSPQRRRGFLAPVVDDAAADDAFVAAADAQRSLEPSGESVEERLSLPDDSPAPASDTADEEPLVSIPRLAEAPRQRSLFGGAVDEDLLREAQEICESARRASVVLLQRKLRIDYEQARVVLAQLAERGVLELQEDGTQGRVRT